MLTLVIPVKNPHFLSTFIKENLDYLKMFEVITIDSGGGELLKAYSTIYLQKAIPLWEARLLAYSLVKTPFVLNLDCDVIIPKGYIEEALKILQEDKQVGVLSIFFQSIEKHAGILEYGISIWRTDLLREIYDYKPKNSTGCECLHIWRKLFKTGYRLETLPYRAKHLKL